MVRYRYNSQVTPPAPFVHVTIRHPTGTEEISNVAALLDTAADMTVLPGEIIERLGLVPADVVPVAGLGGLVEDYPAYFVEVALGDRSIAPVKAIGSSEEAYILLGRDVLNHFQIMLDGPQGILEIT
jgi:predicted aspartyl protease